MYSRRSCGWADAISGDVIITSSYLPRCWQRMARFENCLATSGWVGPSSCRVHHGRGVGGGRKGRGEERREQGKGEE